MYGPSYYAVCLYVYMYVCIPLCTHACLYPSMYTCMSVFLYVYMYVCIPLCIHVCLYSSMYACVPVCVCLFLWYVSFLFLRVLFLYICMVFLYMCCSFICVYCSCIHVSLLYVCIIPLAHVDILRKHARAYWPCFWMWLFMRVIIWRVSCASVCVLLWFFVSVCVLLTQPARHTHTQTHTHTQPARLDGLTTVIFCFVLISDHFERFPAG